MSTPKAHERRLNEANVKENKGKWKKVTQIVRTSREGIGGNLGDADGSLGDYVGERKTRNPEETKIEEKKKKIHC